MKAEREGRLVKAGDKGRFPRGERRDALRLRGPRGLAVRGRRVLRGILQDSAFLADRQFLHSVDPECPRKAELKENDEDKHCNYTELHP